jgi:hypothetical protein
MTFQPEEDTEMPTDAEAPLDHFGAETVILTKLLFKKVYQRHKTGTQPS